MFCFILIIKNNNKLYSIKATLPCYETADYNFTFETECQDLK